MKKVMSVMFVLLFAMVLAGVGVSAASAAQAAYYGPPVKPYLYTGIDANGGFINPTAGPDTWNSMQMVVYDAVSKGLIISAHPNYDPFNDDQTTATATTMITAVQFYNPTSGYYQDCLVGGTLVIPEAGIQETVAGYPYVQFNITLTRYVNATGAVVSPSPYVYPVAFLDLTSVTH
jgi:hypothetical protein